MARESAPTLERLEAKKAADLGRPRAEHYPRVRPCRLIQICFPELPRSGVMLGQECIPEVQEFRQDCTYLIVREMPQQHLPYDTEIAIRQLVGDEIALLKRYMLAAE